MAARFLAAGYPVFGEQQNRAGAEHLIEQGLQWRDSPQEVAMAADVVFTSVPDDAAVEDVASGTDGILAGLGADKTWIDVSTISPQASKELAGRVRSAKTARRVLAVTAMLLGAFGGALLLIHRRAVAPLVLAAALLTLVAAAARYRPHPATSPL